MSVEDNEVDTRCASCGIVEVDDVKLLVPCDGCDLVRYCSDACRELHRPEHEEDCKIRAAELRDEFLDPSCRCASCGITEIMDDIELVPCDNCRLYRYCSDECRENHKSEHDEQCKKLAAQLREIKLFQQQESSYLGDCPICCLPLSLDKSKSAMMMCCSKIICNG